MPRNEAASYTKRYKVSNIKTLHGEAQLRILSAERPADNAVLEEAVLEDVFLHYFGERAGGGEE